MKKEFERVAELKEQMRTILDKAESEKRSLNDDEKTATGPHHDPE